MKHVELCGLPGSGKTTYADVLIDRLHASYQATCPVDQMMKDNGVQRAEGLIKGILKHAGEGVFRQFFGWDTRLAEFRSFLVSNPAYASAVFSLIEEMKYDQEERWTVINSWMRSCIECQVATEQIPPDGVFIADEGLVHRTFTIFGYRDQSPQTGQIEQYVAHLPLPQMVVLLDCEPEICLQRIASRSRTGASPRLARWPEQDRGHILESGRRILESVAGELERRNVTVVRVNTSGSMAEVNGQIEQAAERFCAASERQDRRGQ